MFFFALNRETCLCNQTKTRGLKAGKCQELCRNVIRSNRINEPDHEILSMDCHTTWRRFPAHWMRGFGSDCIKPSDERRVVGRKLSRSCNQYYRSGVQQGDSRNQCRLRYGRLADVADPIDGGSHVVQACYAGLVE